MPRYPRRDQGSFVARQAMSIKQFCAAFGIGETLFYKLKKQGRGPVEMRIGGRTLISLEAAEAWRRKCEKASRPHSSA